MPELIGQFTNRLDFRTNIAQTVNIQKFIQEPPPGFALKINWWGTFTVSESGDWDVGDELHLVEGIPDNFSSDGRGNGANNARDQNTYKVLHIVHPTGGTATLEVSGDADAGGRFANGLYPYPGGIWSVEDIWVGARVDTGVKRMSFSIGFEHVKLTAEQYQWAKRTGWNSVAVGALLS